MKIKYSSVTHDILRFAKMIKRPFTATEPMHVFARIDRLSKVERSIDTLIKYGYMKDCGDKFFQITAAGIGAVYELARPYAKNGAHKDD
jgi:hypothetical protein